MSDHSSRKADHLDLCATDQVAFVEKSNYLGQVHLIHDALPEMSVDEVDLSTQLAGGSLRAPLIIAAMTGGVERADVINKDLASVAEELGIGFGFGSMRPLLEDGEKAGYFVRDVAPTAFLIGNIGVVQATRTSSAKVADLVHQTGVNALAIHLNPAMEVIQTGGDTDFRGCLDGIARLNEALTVPLIVKETGCGLSRAVGTRLANIGIKTVDVSGAGGTSWVGVETLRARAKSRNLGERFWDWGIPTAASIAALSDLGLECIATGGVRDGLDITRAIALGAAAGGIARVFLQAWNAGGRQAVADCAIGIIDEIRLAHLLTGCRTPDDLHKAKLVLGPDLRSWVPRGSSLSKRSS
jgi:isopentenyl-diphosphate delta-isomerase